MVLYSSGRVDGLMAEVSHERISVLAVCEGHAIHDALTSVPIYVPADGHSSVQTSTDGIYT
jgi:hypothetical protein